MSPRPILPTSSSDLTSAHTENVATNTVEGSKSCDGRDSTLTKVLTYPLLAVAFIMLHPVLFGFLGELNYHGRFIASGFTGDNGTALGNFFWMVILEILITVTLANFSKTNFWMGLLTFMALNSVTLLAIGSVTHLLRVSKANNDRTLLRCIWGVSSVVFAISQAIGMTYETNIPLAPAIVGSHLAIGAGFLDYNLSARYRKSEAIDSSQASDSSADADRLQEKDASNLV